MPSCSECENDLDIELDEVEEGRRSRLRRVRNRVRSGGREPLELSRVGDGLDEDDEPIEEEEEEEVKYSRVGLLAGAMFVSMAAGLVPAGPRGELMGAPEAQAQNIGQRVVEGKVVDASSAAVSGGTVFLKNLKTKSIRSYTTSDDGRFRFTQVERVGKTTTSGLKRTAEKARPKA